MAVFYSRGVFPVRYIPGKTGKPEKIVWSVDARNKFFSLFIQFVGFNDAPQDQENEIGIIPFPVNGLSELEIEFPSVIVDKIFKFLNIPEIMFGGKKTIVSVLPDLTQNTCPG